MSPHDSQFSRANVRNPSKFILPPLDSAFDRLKMNSSRPSARYHSCGIEPLEVMALAGRLAGPDNAVPSLPDSDSWPSEKKQKNPGARSCVPTLHVLVESSYILDVVASCRNILDLDRQQTCLGDHCVHHGACRALRAPLFDCVTCAIWS